MADEASELKARLAGCEQALDEIADAVGLDGQDHHGPGSVIGAVKQLRADLEWKVNELKGAVRIDFAGKALQGFCANPNYRNRREEHEVARDSVAHADALIAALMRKSEGG